MSLDLDEMRKCSEAWLGIGPQLCGPEWGSPCEQQAVISWGCRHGKGQPVRTTELGVAVQPNAGGVVGLCSVVRPGCPQALTCTHTHRLPGQSSLPGNLFVMQIPPIPHSPPAPVALPAFLRGFESHILCSMGPSGSCSPLPHNGWQLRGPTPHAPGRGAPAADPDWLGTQPPLQPQCLGHCPAPLTEALGPPGSLLASWNTPGSEEAVFFSFLGCLQGCEPRGRGAQPCVCPTPQSQGTGLLRPLCSPPALGAEPDQALFPQDVSAPCLLPPHPGTAQGAWWEPRGAHEVDQAGRVGCSSMTCALALLQPSHWPSATARSPGHGVQPEQGVCLLRVPNSPHTAPQSCGLGTRAHCVPSPHLPHPHCPAPAIRATPQPHPPLPHLCPFAPAPQPQPPHHSPSVLLATLPLGPRPCSPHNAHSPYPTYCPRPHPPRPVLPTAPPPHSLPAPPSLPTQPGSLLPAPLTPGRPVGPGFPESWDRDFWSCSPSSMWPSLRIYAHAPGARQDEPRARHPPCQPPQVD